MERMRSRKLWCFSHPTTPATSPERNCSSTEASLKSESHEYYYRHYRAVADATRIAKGARTSKSRRAEPQACCSGQKRGIRNRGSANIDSRASWKDKMVTAARWPRDCDTAVPSRWAWVPANGNCKVANAGEQTRNLMIIEFNDVTAKKEQTE